MKKKINKKNLNIGNVLLLAFIGFLICAPISTVSAEIHSFDYVLHNSFSSESAINSIDVNEIGETYYGGYINDQINLNFTGSGDTDNSEVVDNIFSTEAMLVKLDQNAQYDWGIHISDYTGVYYDSRVFAVDSNSQRVAFGGRFAGQEIDFNASETGLPDYHDSDASSAPQLSNAFVSVYDSDGNYLWTRSFGGNGNDYIWSVNIDSANNVYIAGTFAGQNVEFNTTGSGDSDIKSSGTTFNSDGAFIIKYDSDGNYLWGHAFSDPSYDGSLGDIVETPMDLEVSETGNVVFAGVFNRTLNLNPTGSGPDVTTTAVSDGEDIFITSLDSDGNYQWSQTLGIENESPYLSTSGLELDSNGNIFISGSINDVDIDYNQTGVGDPDIHNGTTFISKYSSEGVYQWSRAFGNNTSAYADITYLSIGPEDSILAMGWFEESGFDFDDTPGGTDFVTTNGNDDIFIVRYMSDGSYDDTWNLGGDGYDYELGISYNNGLLLLNYEWDSTDIYMDPFANVSASLVEGNNDNDSYYSSSLFDFNQLFQISNLDSELDVVDETGESIKAGSLIGKTSNSVKVFLKQGTKYISEIIVDLTAERDWSSVNGDSDLLLGKSVVAGLISAPGTSSSHALYIPKLEATSVPYICPNASTLEEVIIGCSGGYYADSYSTVTLDGQEYFKISGLTGTGGLSTNPPIDESLDEEEESNDNIYNYTSIISYSELNDSAETVVDENLLYTDLEISSNKSVSDTSQKENVEEDTQPTILPITAFMIKDSANTVIWILLILLAILIIFLILKSNKREEEIRIKKQEDKSTDL